MNRCKSFPWMIAAGVSVAILTGYHMTQRRLAGRWGVLEPGRPQRTPTGRRFPIRRALSVLGVALTLLLFTTAAVSASPREWTTICHHIVRTHETLYCIARAYGVSPSAIAAHNGITNPNLIYVGRVLAIPDAYASLPSGPICPRQCPPYTPGCSCATYHTVARGENLYRIGVRYGVNMWRIAECNSITNLNLIHAGDVLCIPATS